MLPFVRMFDYGNVAPTQPQIKQMEFVNSGVYLLYDNGELYYRGRNANGQMGDGTNTIKNTEWYLSNTNVEMISRGISTIPMIMKKDNTFWMSGSFNLFGITGWVNYTWTDVTSYFSSVASGLVSFHSNSGGVFVLKNDGTLHAAGRNTNGQMGMGSVSSTTTFIEVANSINPNPENIRTVTDGCYYVSNDNKLYGTGVNSNGRLGVGTTLNVTSFSLANSGTAISTTYPLVKSVMAISNGANILASTSDNSNTVVLASGTLSGVGTGNTSGTSSSFEYYSPMNSTDFKILKLSTTLGNTSAMLVMTDNGVYATGNNSNFQLGTGNNTTQNVYVKSIGLPDNTNTSTIRFFGSGNEGSACVYHNSLYVTGVLSQWGDSYNTFTLFDTPY